MQSEVALTLTLSSKRRDNSFLGSLPRDWIPHLLLTVVTRRRRLNWRMTKCGLKAFFLLNTRPQRWAGSARPLPKGSTPFNSSLQATKWIAFDNLLNHCECNWTRVGQRKKRVCTGGTRAWLPRAVHLRPPATSSTQSGTRAAINKMLGYSWRVGRKIEGRIAFLWFCFFFDSSI